MFRLASPYEFSPEAAARDQIQLTLLADLMRHDNDRYVLKGGMAMRALYGSARLTKDIDFDCDQSVSTQSMRNRVTQSLNYAGRTNGLGSLEIRQTKNGDASKKWKLVGRIAGDRTVTFDVEVSLRNPKALAGSQSMIVEPPFECRIPRFSARAYSLDMMAYSKVMALLSPNRNAPRDVFDLADLHRAGASPAVLLARSTTPETLIVRRAELWSKIDEIDFDLARDELLPYLPKHERDRVTESEWNRMSADVAAQVDLWIHAALLISSPLKEPDDDAGSAVTPSF